MQQGVTCEIWSIAIKVIYQIFVYYPNRDLEKKKYQIKRMKKSK